jgi:hypothetical protein
MDGRIATRGMLASTSQALAVVASSPEVADPMPFPVDMRWITQTEAKLGVKFPVSFVIAMAKMNGGSVKTSIDTFELFPFLDASDRKRIQRTCGSIDRETAAARKGWTGFPPEAVAIGANGGGDYLVLLPMPGHPEALRHSVYWWDHETAEVGWAADDFADLPKS